MLKELKDNQPEEKHSMTTFSLEDIEQNKKTRCAQRNSQNYAF